MNSSLVVTLCLLLVLMSGLSEGLGRGRSSRSRSSRSRSSRSRSAGSRIIKTVGKVAKSISEFSGSEYSGVIAAGLVAYGLEAYKERYGGTSHFDEDPSVCFSQYITVDDFSGELESGLFVCPDGDDPAQSYCCGDKEFQYCCAFWDDEGRTGKVVGGTIGGVLFVALDVVIGVFCYHRRCR